MASNELQLKIKQIRKPSFVVSVAADGSIEDLREQIHQASDVEPNRQRLIYMGRVLKSDKSISTYNLKNNDTLHMIVRDTPVSEPRNDEPVPPQPQPHQPPMNHSVQGMAVLGVAAPEDSLLEEIMGNVLQSIPGGNAGGGIFSSLLRSRAGSHGSLSNMVATTLEVDECLERVERMFQEATSSQPDPMDVDGDDATARLEQIADAVLGDGDDGADIEVDESLVEEEKGQDHSLENLVATLHNVSASLYDPDRQRYLDETIALLSNHSGVENREETQNRIHRCGEILYEYGTILTGVGHAMRRVHLGATSEEATVDPLVQQQIQVTAYNIQHMNPLGTGAVVPGSGNGPDVTAVVDVDVEVDIDTTNARGADNGANPQQNILDGLLQSFGVHQVVSQPNGGASATSQPAASATAPPNPMANIMQSVVQMMGARGQGQGQASNPLQMLSGLFPQNPRPQPVPEEQDGLNVVPEQLVRAFATEIVRFVEISSIAACQTGNWSVLRSLHVPLREFLERNNIFDRNAAARRSQVSRDLVLGVSRLLVGRFAQDKREILRTVTETHFRNHMRRLVDILADSSSPEVFENALLEWGKEALTAWIYKLSVNFRNGISGVKGCLSQIGIQWLGSLGVRQDRLQVVPEFVKHFVDGAYRMHVERLQEHGTQARLSSQDEWAYTLPPGDRQRWLRTVQMDGRRAHQQVLHRGYQFSPAYSGQQTSEEQSSGIREERRRHFSESTPHAKKRRLNPKKDGES